MSVEQRLGVTLGGVLRCGLFCLAMLVVVDYPHVLLRGAMLGLAYLAVRGSKL